MFSSRENGFNLFPQRNIVLLLFSLLFLRCVRFPMCSKLFFGNKVRPFPLCFIRYTQRGIILLFLAPILTGTSVSVMKSFLQLTLSGLVTWSPEPTCNGCLYKGGGWEGCRLIKRKLCSDFKVKTLWVSTLLDTGLSTALQKKTKSIAQNSSTSISFTSISLFITINVGTHILFLIGAQNV